MNPCEQGKTLIYVSLPWLYIVQDRDCLYVSVFKHLCLLHFMTTTDGIQEQNNTSKTLFSSLPPCAPPTSDKSAIAMRK